jgi:hypothetical protein
MNGTDQTNLFLGTKYLVTHDGGTERMTLVRIEDDRIKFIDEDASGVWINRNDIACMAMIEAIQQTEHGNFSCQYCEYHADKDYWEGLAQDEQDALQAAHSDCYKGEIA